MSICTHACRDQHRFAKFSKTCHLPRTQKRSVVYNKDRASYGSHCSGQHRGQRMATSIRCEGALQGHSKGHAPEAAAWKSGDSCSGGGTSDAATPDAEKEMPLPAGSIPEEASLAAGRTLPCIARGARGTEASSVVGGSCENGCCGACAHCRGEAGNSSTPPSTLDALLLRLPESEAHTTDADSTSTPKNTPEESGTNKLNLAQR